MHDEASPPFDGEEAGLATKTTQTMIYRYICMWYIDTYESWDIPGKSIAILDFPGSNECTKVHNPRWHEFIPQTYSNHFTWY